LEGKPTLKNLPRVELRNAYIPFKGGLDTETPQISMKPGYLRNGYNIEQMVNGGYQTIMGYTRYTGQATTGNYVALAVECIDEAVVAVGDVITGETSGVTGTVLALEISQNNYLVDENGDYLQDGLGNFIVINSGYIIATDDAGTFGVEGLEVGGVACGVRTGVYTNITAQEDSDYRALAASVSHASLAAVPGSGSILGVWKYNGHVYAWRNNVAGTAAVMWVASASGWVAVTHGYEISFDTGILAVAVGDTLTGDTSGTTAIVTRVVVEYGSWSAGTAAGRLIVSTPSAAFQAENLKVSGSIVCTSLGNASLISFAVPSGRFKCINYNFSGDPTTYRMYGCDGKNRGFEYDGVVLVPINSKFSPDTPENVIAHKYHLFFSFSGTLQHSAPTTPYNFEQLIGAAAIGLGDAITGFVSLTGDATSAALAVFSRNEIGILYGSNSSDWQMVSYKTGAGAIANTVQPIAGATYLDERGLTTLAASVEYGNFKDADISSLIYSWLRGKQIYATDSCILRNKSQYRIFFSDKSALFATISNNKVVGICPVKLDHVVACMCSSESTALGEEEVYFGGTDGMVYQMETGMSFDGANLDWLCELSYNSLGSPHIIKRFRKIIPEVTGDGYAEFYMGYSLDYGSKSILQHPESMQTVSLNTWYFDDGVSYWDTGLYFDGDEVLPIEKHTMGSGRNISLTFRGSGTTNAQIRFNGAQLLYSISKIKR